MYKIGLWCVPQITECCSNNRSYMRTRNWTMSSLDPNEHVVYVVHKAVQTGLVQVCERSFKHLSLIMEVKRG